MQQFGFYAGDQWRVASEPDADLRRCASTCRTSPTSRTPTRWRSTDFGYAHRRRAGADDVVAAHRLQLGSERRRRQAQQIRGGIGSFTGRTPYVWLSNQYGNTGVRLHGAVGRRSTPPTAIPFVADPHNQPTTVTGGATGRQTINMIDPNYKYPQVLRGNIAYDRELPFWGLVGTAEFVWSKTQQGHALEEPELGADRRHASDGRLVFKKFDANINDAVDADQHEPGRHRDARAARSKGRSSHGWYASGSYLKNRSRTISDGGAFVGAQLVARPVRRSTIRTTRRWRARTTRPATAST